MSQIFFYMGVFALVMGFAIVGLEVFVNQGLWKLSFFVFCLCLVASFLSFFVSYLLEGLGE